MRKGGITKERRTLTNQQWRQLLRFFYHHPWVYIGQGLNLRRFISGVVWLMRTGAPWRDVPERYGAWNSIYQRDARWCDRGIWAALFTLEVTQLKSGVQRSSTFAKSRTSEQVRNSYTYCAQDPDRE